MTEKPTNVTPPPDLTYGYVDGRIILAIGDRSDAGRMPDPVPADGMTVTLTPANTILKVASPTPATVVKQPIPCGVDANGYLIDRQAARGVWLVTGTYKVTYSHPRATIPSHDIEVTTGHTEAAPLDLTTAMPPGGPVLTPSEYAELNGRLTILEAGGGGGGGGVTDHGMLTGLGDDDHTQYLTAGRGDARYAALGDGAAAVSAHLAAGDPHPAYATAAEAAAAAPVQAVAGRTGAVTLVAADVSDSTAVGRSVLTATDATAARAAIGASSLALGTTAGTAAEGTDPRLSGRYVGVNAQTGTTYTPVASDEGKLVTLSNAAAITVTLPQDSDLAMPVGARIDMVPVAAGMVTFVAGTGATVNGTPSLVTRAQWSAATVVKRAANTWLVVGDLA